MPERIVDVLEPIDVDHQATDASGVPLGARQLFLQSLLQIASIVPTGQEVGDAGAQQARAIDRIFDTHGGHRAQVREKIRAA